MQEDLDLTAIQKFIDENLLARKQARVVTEQSLSAFDQSVRSGVIAPFCVVGAGTKLYLKSDLEGYATRVKARRERLDQERDV